MTAHAVPHHATVSTLPSPVEWVMALLWPVFAFVAEHHAIAHAAAVAGRVLTLVGSVAGVILLGVTP